MNICNSNTGYNPAELKLDHDPIIISVNDKHYLREPCASRSNTDTELNTNTLNRIQDIDKLNEKDKELVFEFLNSFISNRKIKKALN